MADRHNARSRRDDNPSAVFISVNQSIIQRAVELRRGLHRQPEQAGEERTTAERIADFLTQLGPETVHRGLGGHGLAAEFRGDDDGPTILLRAELDALPIQEKNSFPHRSEYPNTAHLCGHDGHMAILAAVAGHLSRRRPARGRVVLLFQPAEETGQGAKAVVEDPQFPRIAPDFAFALHNLPGVALGRVVLREGSFSSASRGLSIGLDGATAHAAQPETGRSPGPALCTIISQFNALTAEALNLDETAFATVVGARLGDKAFGTAPGQARIWTTLRSESDRAMDRLVALAESIAREVAADYGLELTLAYEDVFPATHCDPAAVALVRRAAAPLTVEELPSPMRWSEDFGHFTARCPGALFGLGAGGDTAPLHDARYDFPDALIELGAALFLRLIDVTLDH